MPASHVIFTALAVLALATVICAVPAIPQPRDNSKFALRVMSFNIRLHVASDGENAWPHRRDFVVETIRKYSPDLLGAQEVLAHQGDFLREQLKDYGFVGTGRDDGARKGEFSPIFYRLDRFRLIDSGQLWLSKTPEAVGSVGWDAALPRVMTWAKLEDRAAGRTLLFVNTHFDHRGEQARLQSAKLIRQKVEQLAETMPAIVVGDFNCAEGSAPYRELTTDLRDSYRIAHPTTQPDESSFHGFRGTREGKRIDWILCSPQWKVRGASIDRTAREGRYPSDHFAVTCELEQVVDGPRSARRDTKR